MYPQNLHPATYGVFSFVLHMDNGLFEAALNPHILTGTHRGDVIDYVDEKSKRIRSTSRGVLSPPSATGAHSPCVTTNLARGQVSDDGPPQFHDMSGHLFMTPEPGGPLCTKPLTNITNNTTGRIYVDSSGARGHGHERVSIFARKQASPEEDTTGWTLVDHGQPFNARWLRRGIELRFASSEHVTGAAVWDGTVRVRFDLTDTKTGLARSDTVPVRIVPELRLFEQLAGSGGAGFEPPLGHDTSVPRSYYNYSGFGETDSWCNTETIPLQEPGAGEAFFRRQSCIG